MNKTIYQHHEARILLDNLLGFPESVAILCERILVTVKKRNISDLSHFKLYEEKWIIPQYIRMAKWSHVENIKQKY